MPGSAFSRLWDTIKPPSGDQGPKKPLTAQQRKQRQMILYTLGVIALGAIGWEIYAYIASAPQRAQKQFDEAEKLTGPAKYADAIAGFTKAIDIYPMPEAYLERGLAYHQLHQDDDALADLQRAIDLNGYASRAYAIRAGIYQKRGDTNRAMEEYAKSIQASPNVDAFYERGQIYESMGQHQKAIDDYDQAISYLRNAPYVYRARAFAKQNLGDEEGAENDRKIARSFERR